MQIEDDENDARLLVVACREQRLPLAFNWVSDGLMAIGYLKGEGTYQDREKFPEPDLVLLDLKLPKKSGFDVLRWIRTEYGRPDVPVIVLSGSDEPADRARALAGRANEYFVKPVDYQSLGEIVRGACNRWLEASESGAPARCAGGGATGIPLKG